jgi:hypothetical protein
MLLVLLGVFELALVDCAFYVACIFSLAFVVASMALNLWCFYGLNYVTAYICLSIRYICACFYDTAMVQHTWYLVTLNEFSLLFVRSSVQKQHDRHCSGPL